MCGIAGFVGPRAPDVLRGMASCLVHRGPDGEGFYIDEASGVHLAHRRLSILDIEGGHQPMWNEDQTVCVIFNGEIYNHLELRSQLLELGHVFATDHSDTEVLVHGYEEWEEALPQRLNGMFAFAIFDRTRKRIFMARDRFGEKPLFFVDRPELFGFASEVTALLHHPGVDRSVDLRALKKYFAYSLIPAPLSLYRSICKLPAGHCMTYDLEARRTHQREYWRFSIEPYSEATVASEAEWEEELRQLLERAVRRRLVADVPLGIFLSGGIDSSAVLAYAKDSESGKHTETFSIGFTERSYDESSYARMVADHFATHHHEQILSIDRARALIPEILSRLDEPIADSSIVPTYLLSKFARSHVKVALGGDGGDELFAGYDPFKALAPASWYRRCVPAGIHRLLRLLASRLPVSSDNMSLEFKVRRALRGVSFDARLWNPVWLGSLEPREIAELLGEPTSTEELYSEAIEVWNSSSATNLVDKTMEFYTRIYLPDDILTKVDRASMMVSLEVRAPFLDNDLVEFVRRLPHWSKYRRGDRKALLKSALKGLLPDEIIRRRKKGFGIPLVRWMRDCDRPEFPALEHLVDKHWADARWREHCTGRADYRHFMWSWLALGYHLIAHPSF
jgi:asparagine synthase (glutamine-hydrolysing)